MQRLEAKVEWVFSNDLCIDSKEKRASNLVHIKIQIEAKNKNKLSLSYIYTMNCIKTAELNKNSDILYFWLNFVVCME